MSVAGSAAGVIPRHQWTHDGADVLIVKCVEKDGTSYGGFRWPLTVGAEVIAPDWRDDDECGGGLHGWPWGFSLGVGKDPDWSATWLVFSAAPVDVRDLGGKVKTRAGVVRYVGDWQGATAFVLAGQMAWVHQAAHGAASSTGSRGAASSTGSQGAASSTGDWGAASSTGDASAAVVTGRFGRAQAGPFGVIALSRWNEDAERYEMHCARVGVGDGSDGLLKARVWYTLDESTGAFMEVAQ